MPNGDEVVRFELVLDDNSQAQITRVFEDGSRKAAESLQRAVEDADRKISTYRLKPGPVSSVGGTSPLPYSTVPSVYSMAPFKSPATTGLGINPTYLPGAGTQPSPKGGNGPFDCCKELLLALKNIDGRLYDITLAVRTMVAGQTGGSGSRPPPLPKTGGGTDWQSMLQHLQQMAVTGSVGALGLAGNPAGGLAGAFGTAGGIFSGAGMAATAMGQPEIGVVLAALGSATAALGRLTSAAMEAAESLRDFGPQIGAVMNELDIWTIGIKMQISQGIGPALTDLIHTVMGFVSDFMPEIIQITKAIIEALTWFLKELKQNLQFAILLLSDVEVVLGQILQDLAQYKIILDVLTNGASSILSSDQIKAAGDAMVKDGMERMTQIILAIQNNTATTNDLLRQGHEQNVGFLTALNIYAHKNVRAPDLSGTRVENVTGGILERIPRVPGNVAPSFTPQTPLYLDPDEQNQQTTPHRYVKKHGKWVKPNTGPNQKDADHQGAEHTSDVHGSSASSGRFPIPSQTPIQANFHNKFELTPEDDDRLFVSLQDLKNEAISAARNSQDLRWMRLSAARMRVFG